MVQIALIGGNFNNYILRVAFIFYEVKKMSGDIHLTLIYVTLQAYLQFHYFRHYSSTANMPGNDYSLNF